MPLWKHPLNFSFFIDRSTRKESSTYKSTGYRVTIDRWFSQNFCFNTSICQEIFLIYNLAFIQLFKTNHSLRNQNSCLRFFLSISQPNNHPNQGKIETLVIKNSYSIDTLNNSCLKMFEIWWMDWSCSVWCFELFINVAKHQLWQQICCYYHSHCTQLNIHTLVCLR